MKAIFALFALCLVAVHAGTVPEPPINYEVMVDDILSEMGQVAKDAAVALQYSLEDIVLDPLRQVNEAVENIEARRTESEVCVAAEDVKVASIVDAMHNDMSTCGTVAAKTSAEIMTDISAATQQLIYDGYDILTTYRRCQRYTNVVLQNSCYARLSIKATLYLVNARRSIKTIRESINERIPAVVADAADCTHSAADTALQGLAEISATIDACIAKH